MASLKQVFTITAIAAALVACNSSDKDKKNSDPFKSISSVSKLAIECNQADIAKHDADKTDSVTLTLVDSYDAGNDFETSSAEIVTYDKCSDRLYVVNAEDASIDVLKFDEDSAPSKLNTIDLSAAAKAANISIGSANSVVAKHGLVAVAIENAVKQEPGIIALYRSDTLALLNTYTAGALPDMVNMTEDARYIVVANEGEPNASYSIDPEGSVTIVDLKAGVANDKAKVSQVDFNELDTQVASLKANGVRLPMPKGASVSQDLEPEYAAITLDGKAVVALQENNAFMTIDLASKKIEQVKGLGTKSWDSASKNKLDYTNKDKTYKPTSVEQMVGLYMPDSISSFIIDGETYIISANEGDGREYLFDVADEAACTEAGGIDYDKDDGCLAYTDEARAEDLTAINNLHPLSAASFGAGSIEDGDGLGRIKVAYDNVDQVIAADEDILTFGARSFSIWDMNTDLVYDSGSKLSEIANDSVNFNHSNSKNSSDDRSDDKGIEPEATEIAVINGETIAFIGLERQGGVAVFNVSKPTAPEYLYYINNRDFNVDIELAGDLGPESIEYFSRVGKHFIAVGNEVSGTTTVFEVNMN